LGAEGGFFENSMVGMGCNMERAMNQKILKLGTIRTVFYEKFLGFFCIIIVPH